DQQPLVISRQAVGSLYARFLTDPDVRDCLTYIIRWDQVLDRYAGFFYIAFHSPNSKTMGSVEFRSGGQMTANGSNHVLDATYAPGTVVSIEVRLDIADGLMDVSVNGVPDPSGQDLGPVQGGGDGLKDISTGFGLVDTYTVALDNLEIVGLNCGGVANEAVSWGELKARYR
ncbi:MAG TPA: hypothetical protein P5571_14625, partial [Candidatus Krumholzibacteria bacterium]|nr:hypothetical protein [Candidatus Krumholzibacteria bacterium]